MGSQRSLSDTADKRHTIGWRRRGSAYIAVLGVALTISVIGLSAMWVGRIHLRTATMQEQLASTRLMAVSTMELAAAVIQTDVNWRSSLDGRTLTVDTDQGPVTVEISLSDPVDGNLADSVCDPVELQGIAWIDDVRRIYQVELELEPVEDVIGELRPLAYWPLTEGSGLTAVDMKAGSPGGYKNGIALAARDHNCQPAPHFDGSNDFVEIPHSDSFLTDNGSVSLWFLADRTWGENGLISKDCSAYETGGHLTIWYKDGGILVRLQSDYFSVYVSHGSVSGSQWHHVCFTFGMGGMRLYVDGNLVDSDPYPGGLGLTSGDAGNYEPIGIGVGLSQTDPGTTEDWDDPFSGSISEVAWFDRALGPDEVNRIYEAGRERVLVPKPGSWQRVVE